MTTEEQVERIHARMYRRRLDPNSDVFAGWNQLEHWDYKPKAPRLVILEHLLAGHEVNSGYYTTKVRGYHEHYIFWREKPK